MVDGSNYVTMQIQVSNTRADSLIQVH